MIFSKKKKNSNNQLRKSMLFETIGMMEMIQKNKKDYKHTKTNNKCTNYALPINKSMKQIKFTYQLR